jgi:hypothetical protein
MLTVYAAWTEGAVEADLIALREAMDRTDVVPTWHQAVTHTPTVAAKTETALEEATQEFTRAQRGTTRKRTLAAPEAEEAFGTEFGTPEVTHLLKCLTCWRNHGGADGTRTATPGVTGRF